ncbi:MAG: hypothetical protein NTZ78_08835 [Candidatus Aureabacteria bacterium]|nr:hypothetical protein [Candidatus Auribacterota bacterium]
MSKTSYFRDITLGGKHPGPMEELPAPRRISRMAAGKAWEGSHLHIQRILEKQSRMEEKSRRAAG